MASNHNSYEDPRRVANRIRDAYTLTEAEQVLVEYCEERERVARIETLRTIYGMAETTEKHRRIYDYCAMKLVELQTKENR